MSVGCLPSTFPCNSADWVQYYRTRLTPRQSHESLRDHRLRLEDDIAQLERTLVSAKELRNSSAPVLTLPDEVILEILFVLRDSYSVHDRDTEPPAWGACTAICRRIRRIALGSPNLFTQLSTRTSSWNFIDSGM